jgi:hypothetical protein
MRSVSRSRLIGRFPEERREAVEMTPILELSMVRYARAAQNALPLCRLYALIHTVGRPIEFFL